MKTTLLTLTLITSFNALAFDEPITKHCSSQRDGYRNASDYGTKGGDFCINPTKYATGFKTFYDGEIEIALDWGWRVLSDANNKVDGYGFKLEYSQAWRKPIDMLEYRDLALKESLKHVNSSLKEHLANYIANRGK